MAEEKLHFQAEVSRLLDIVAHSLYSEREVFLRELISNASDACDRHRYLALTEPDKAGPAATYGITLKPDTEARTLTLSDNGVGMSRDELVENLGTIARSGTGRFVEQLSGDAKQDVSLIGQFGVGFYSAFMVAELVTVISRKAGEDQAWSWSSDGKGEFTVAEATRDEHGTDVIMTLRADADEFLQAPRLKQIVRRYSDHIALPVVLKTGGTEETLNNASALWTRSRSDITPEQATEFYRHVAHAMDDPYATIHIRAEGALEYSSLLFVPGSKPFDLFNPDRKHGVKLYVRRVFITDEAKDLIPGYLRFLQGVVDSSDLPLNVSREMLQGNPLIAKMRANIVRKVLAELEKKSRDADYAQFWENFGSVLKEGIYEDSDNRPELMKLARFRTTASGDEWISLETYVARMKSGQDAIYTISGEDRAALVASPQLEGYRAKGVEVLLLTDPVDEFWMPAAANFADKPFRSVTRGSADLSKIEGGDEKADAAEAVPSGEVAKLIALFKLTLADAVKDVRESNRLTDSAVCLVADDGDIDMRLEKLLRQHKQLDTISKRVLEINPRHVLVRRLVTQLGKEGASDLLSDAAFLLLDQARILEGEPLPDPRAFARRLDAVLARGFGTDGPEDLAA